MAAKRVTIPKTLVPLLITLSKISLVPHNHKLNVNNSGSVESGSLYGSLVRNWYGESRGNLIVYLNKVIDDTANALYTYNGGEFYNTIMDYLSKARTGVINLQTTYKGDVEMYANLGLCVENINLLLGSKV